MVHLHYGIPHSNRKEQTDDTHNDTDEAQSTLIEKKPDTENTLLGNIHTKLQIRQKESVTEIRPVVAWGRGGGSDC